MSFKILISFLLLAAQVELAAAADKIFVYSPEGDRVIRANGAIPMR